MIRYHTTWRIICQIVMCLGIINTSCSHTDRPSGDYREYYIPMAILPAEGITYTYRNLRDTTAAPEIWSHKKMGEGLIMSTNYDSRGLETQRQYDRLVIDGIVTDSLILMFEDSTGRRGETRVKVVSPYRFPFIPGDSSKVWLTQFEWYQPQDSLHVVLQRRRRFDGDTTMTYHGKTIPAVQFTTDDTLETEEAGWTHSTWQGVEIYAKGIGLIYYKRKISPELTLEYQLN